MSKKKNNKPERSGAEIARQRAASHKFTANIHFRDIESWRYTEENLKKEFRLFVENEILPLLKLRGYKLKAKTEIVAQIAHRLIETGLTNKVLADSRDHNNIDAKKRIPIYDLFVKKGLCKMCKGSEVSGLTTRYSATGKLLERKKEWKLELLEDLNLKKNTEEAKPTSDALVVL